jgi:hypothetical protein
MKKGNVLIFFGKKKKKKHKGMGWIKYKILEDKKGPFMF